MGIKSSNVCCFLNTKPMNKIIYILFVVLGFVSFKSKAQHLQVIGNSIALNTVSEKTIQEVFKAKYQLWENGNSIKIALMKSTTTVGEQTAKTIYSLTGSGMQRYWLSLTFQGRADAPEFFKTENELIEYIKNTPGAIGIVSAESEIPNELLILKIPLK